MRATPRQNRSAANRKVSTKIESPTRADIWPSQPLRETASSAATASASGCQFSCENREDSSTGKLRTHQPIPSEIADPAARNRKPVTSSVLGDRFRKRYTTIPHSPYV